MLLVFSEFINSIVQEYINPAISNHGASLEIVSITKPENIYVIELKLIGPCNKCVDLAGTKQFIRALIWEEVGTNVDFIWL